MRTFVVTPAGRRRYLEALYRHLAPQRHHFDRWLLLVNTSDPADIGFCERLRVKNDWIDTCYAEGSDPSLKNMNIHKFLNEFCADPDAVYLRLDDDVVYLAPDFVKTMVDFRLAHRDPYLVYGNILNNAMITWIHQKLGNVTFPEHTGYTCEDPGGWRDPLVAEALHRAFLKDPTDPKWRFHRWVMTQYERVSVNAVCFFGKDLADGPVDPDEEKYLAVDRPAHLKRPNMVCGQAVCAHYAFYPQRDHMDATDVLGLYTDLAAANPTTATTK